MLSLSKLAAVSLSFIQPRQQTSMIHQEDHKHANRLGEDNVAKMENGCKHGHTLFHLQRAEANDLKCFKDLGCLLGRRLIHVQRLNVEVPAHNIQ